MSSILVQITSGRGPAECAWVVARISDEIVKNAQAEGLGAELIENSAGSEPGTLLSVLIHIVGLNAEHFIRQFEGTIQWIGDSPFKKSHRRKNWFVGVKQVPVPEAVTFSERDIKIEAMRASGPGGQHVNRTESAIRAVHLPTGLTAVSRDERSQIANRKRALDRLSILLARLENDYANAARKTRWDAHNNLTRGNPVRVYGGTEFRLMKSTLKNRK